MNIYHVYSNFDTAREFRYEVAFKTWKLCNFIDIPISDKELKPTSFLKDSDDRILPFFPDLIDRSIEKIKNEENYIIFFTNLDSCLIPSIYDELLKIDDYNTQVYVRTDIPYEYDVPLKLEDFINMETYAGKDGFGFTKNFWINNRSTFKRMIFGAEFWDYIFYLQLKTLSNVSSINKILYHQKHYQKWCDIVYRLTLSSQIYNIKIAKEFLYVNKNLIDQLWNFENLWEKELFNKI